MKPTLKPTLLFNLLIAGAFIVPMASQAQDTSPAALIETFSLEAGRAGDATAGQAFFLATHSGGKPDTPSCTTCHTMDPTKNGQARTGKVIEPMASSVNPARFTDSGKITKWFRRNCNSVLGRECTPGEKADVLAWLSSL